MLVELVSVMGLWGLIGSAKDELVGNAGSERMVGSSLRLRFNFVPWGGEGGVWRSATWFVDKVPFGEAGDSWVNGGLGPELTSRLDVLCFRAAIRRLSCINLASVEWGELVRSI